MATGVQLEARKVLSTVLPDRVRDIAGNRTAGFAAVSRGASTVEQTGVLPLCFWGASTCFLVSLVGGGLA